MIVNAAMVDAALDSWFNSPPQAFTDHGLVNNMKAAITAALRTMEDTMDIRDSTMMLDPDWPPRGSAMNYNEGDVAYGSTGQLFKVVNRQWVRVRDIEVGAKMDQHAPFPTELKELVDKLVYRPGWSFHLHSIDRGQGSQGLTFRIMIETIDTYHPERRIRIQHYMIVPAAAYNKVSWRRWMFEQILLVERHEACEFFQINGERPYAPNHGPGHDPYIVFEEGTRQEKRTSYLGETRDTDDPEPA